MGNIATEDFRNEFVGVKMNRWVRNIQTSLSWNFRNNIYWPVTKNSNELSSSYVVSPYAALILYSRQEMLSKLPRALHFLLLLLSPLSVLLRWMRLNDHVAFNNWLLSTNLYPAHQEEAVISGAGELIQKYPDSFLLLRSLNERTNTKLIKQLKENGYAFLPSRQVYFYDFSKGDIERRHNYQMDQRFYDKSKLLLVAGDAFDQKDFDQAEYLYSLLYLEKYSEYNPAFTADYLKLCQSNGVFKLFGFRADDGALYAVVGFFIMSGVLTAPIVGYDTKRPAHEGLYRHIIAFTLRYAKEQKLLVNLSSGASDFKRLRGGEPVTEWSAVYIRHLSVGRRIGFRIIQGLLIIIALPLLKVLKL